MGKCLLREVWFPSLLIDMTPALHFRLTASLCRHWIQREAVNSGFRSMALNSRTECQWTHVHSWHLQGPRQSQVTFSCGSFKAFNYIRKPFILKRVIVFLNRIVFSRCQQIFTSYYYHSWLQLRYFFSLYLSFSFSSSFLFMFVFCTSWLASECSRSWPPLLEKDPGPKIAERGHWASLGWLRLAKIETKC